MRNLKLLLILFLVILLDSGCASFGQKMKSWLGGGSSSDATANHQAPAVTSFSNSPAVMNGKERRYKRVTKDNFSDDQMMEENAGSLWRKEGQGSYLFAQNNLRIIGDIVSVQVEGKAAENLIAKLTVIKQALAKLEPPTVVHRAPAATSGPAANVPKPDGKTDAQNQQAQNGPENKDQQEEAQQEKIKDQISKFDDVPCRIIEKNTDGSYRVKGQSPVYVGRREYRLIVTGVVRPEDLAADQIASGKIIDSKFDLVATNKEVH